MNELNGKQALQKLFEGNTRFVASHALHPNQTAKRRSELTAGQHPFAVVVGCADSRVPPEIIFDQGLGDLFVIRVAGNIVDDVVLGSIEYAVEHLGVPLVMVLGHESCGAVTASIQGGEPHGHIGSIVKAIQPAVEQAKEQSGDLLVNAIQTNVARVVEHIKTVAPILSQAVKEEKVQVVGGYYNLDTGEVVVL